MWPRRGRLSTGIVRRPVKSSVATVREDTGSDNQRVWLFSKLGEDRYRAASSSNADVRKLDLMMDQDTAWLAGIPAIGDMERLRDKLQEMGFACLTTDQPAEIQPP